jgi:hypothetical protein
VSAVARRAVRIGCFTSLLYAAASARRNTVNRQLTHTYQTTSSRISKAVGARQRVDRGWYVAVACTPGVLGPWPLSEGGAGAFEQSEAEQTGGLGGIHTTAIHRTVDGGLAINHVTVHVPLFNMVAWGETSHGWELSPLGTGTGLSPLETRACGWNPGLFAMTKIKASGGRLRIVPLHMYKRPGGGGEDCSDRPVIARLTDVVPVLIDVVPVDPLCGRLTRATMMLATAATTAASSTCHRSRRRHRLFLDRAAMDQILASRPAFSHHSPYTTVLVADAGRHRRDAARLLARPAGTRPRRRGHLRPSRQGSS